MTHDVVTLTLPLSEGGILCYAKIVSEVPILHQGQRLSQHICNLLISINVLKSYDTSLGHASDVVVLHLNVFRLVMKHRIF